LTTSTLAKLPALRIGENAESVRDFRTGSTWLFLQPVREVADACGLSVEHAVARASVVGPALRVSS